MRFDHITVHCYEPATTKSPQTKGQILTRHQCENVDLFTADTGIQSVHSPALALPKWKKLHVCMEAEQRRCPIEPVQRQCSLPSPLNSVFTSLLSEHTQFRQLNINSINHLLFWSGRAGMGLIPTWQPGCMPTIMPEDSAWHAFEGWLWFLDQFKSSCAPCCQRV